jgi:pimeloyl-ACP methyl ester carboxylesterase
VSLRPRPGSGWCRWPRDCSPPGSGPRWGWPRNAPRWGPPGVLRPQPRAPDGGPGYGDPPGTPHPGARPGTAPDLYVEVDQPDRRPAGTGPSAEALTVVFCHGHALTLDAWHFQREALRGRHRLVFWDQRGHGRSGPGTVEAATIDQIGRDLAAVLDAVAPTGPLVLVGHSMGGMAIMSLAQLRPELFTDRVLGVALVATSAGDLSGLDLGMTLLGRWMPRLVPGAAALLGRAPAPGGPRAVAGGPIWRRSWSAGTPSPPRCHRPGPVRHRDDRRHQVRGDLGVHPGLRRPRQTVGPGHPERAGGRGPGRRTAT